MDADGDFRVIMAFESGRSQQVFVRSRTSTLDGLEIREIFSPAAVGDSLDRRDNLLLLLLANHDYTLGAWELEPAHDGHAALFTLRVPADPEAAVLRRLIGAAAQAADEMELTLTGRDDL